ncbi:hypothetical protein OQJ02_05080 [Legionella sp. PATHC032]|uniref:hypothetical protein n=1 Tax=Legionella sp. PATHC032 TaxID=2992039 RepID=UPI001B20CFF8|nr:hypothetical protein [Legionella sp. PATHC032]MCW8421003.1 hypothetical protein [Legionella sp. PATHC032]HAZ7573798.1 hypothetical protein [Legionella pneumophila]HBA1634304.1 hypothetical protein [Legionella pneumophila]
MKTLSETNPYLQDKEQAKRLNARSTRTSCGVEGIVKHNLPPMEIDHSRSDKVLKEMKQRLQDSSEKSKNS